MTFATNLRAARIAAGLTQQALADRLGVHQPLIVRWERGQTSPGVHWLPRIAEALGCEVGRLIGGGK
jgi:transcriptional regulator with XRE-family HTH domain